MGALVDVAGPAPPRLLGAVPEGAPITTPRRDRAGPQFALGGLSLARASSELRVSFACSVWHSGTCPSSHTVPKCRLWRYFFAPVRSFVARSPRAGTARALCRT